MTEAFVVCSLAELPYDPISVYVPLAEGADRKSATAALKSLVAVTGSAFALHNLDFSEVLFDMALPGEVPFGAHDSRP